MTAPASTERTAAMIAHNRPAPRPSSWRRNGRGNLVRNYALVPGDGGTLTVFRRDGAYRWCVRLADDAPVFSDEEWATEAEARAALLRLLAAAAREGR